MTDSGKTDNAGTAPAFFIARPLEQSFRKLWKISKNNGTISDSESETVQKDKAGKYPVRLLVTLIPI